MCLNGVFDITISFSYTAVSVPSGKQLKAHQFRMINRTYFKPPSLEYKQLSGHTLQGSGENVKIVNLPNLLQDFIRKEKQG
jgi:hypothetical protein